MGIKRLTYIFCTFLLSVYLHITNAQDSYLNFFHLSVNDGLSNNSVNAITSDDEGFTWIATHIGLNRFDGSKFHVFKHEKDSFSLPSNFIELLFCDKSGNLWVSTNLTGISKYIPATGRFKPYLLATESQPTLNTKAISIVEDSDSILFVATENSLFYKLTISQKYVHNFTYININRQFG